MAPPIETSSSSPCGVHRKPGETSRRAARDADKEDRGGPESRKDVAERFRSTSSEDLPKTTKPDATDRKNNRGDEGSFAYTAKYSACVIM